MKAHADHGKIVKFIADFEGLGLWVALYEDNCYRILVLPAIGDVALRALERFRDWHKTTLKKKSGFAP